MTVSHLFTGPRALVLGLFFVLMAGAASASPLNGPAYYGDDFYSRVQGRMRDQQLVDELRKILVSMHEKTGNGGADRIVSHCDAAARGCYGHTPIGYGPARRVIMGQLYLEDYNGQPGIEEVYCQRDFTKDDFRSAPYPGPGNIPDNTILNVEHTWPQSRFNSRMNRDTQKCDLHHLFPSHSQMNSIRGNKKFGEVDRPAFALPCPISKMGSIQGRSGDYFEPPAAHKGNVARALFYFSVRYSIAIDSEEEAFLKRWNQMDPVDQEEKDRNDQIQRIQGNRNPFVDFPEMADQISNF